MALMFLPGTIIHELSHFLVAILLFVPVGKIELWPKLEDGENLKLGSVQIGKADIIRRLLVGMAPFFIGTAILLSMFFFVVKFQVFDNRIIDAIVLYLAFAIGNSMFSSRKDMEGAIEVVVFLILVGIIAYFTGFKITSLNLNDLVTQPIIQETLQKGCLFLLIPLGIDIAIIFLLRSILKHRF